MAQVAPRAEVQATRSFECLLLFLSNVSNDRSRAVSLVDPEGARSTAWPTIRKRVRTEILETLFGLRSIESGKLEIDGRQWLPKNPATRSSGHRPGAEDRHVKGLVLDHSIERTVTRHGFPICGGAGCWNARRRSGAEMVIDKLAVKAQGASSLVRTLSGGNQQKVVFGKWTIQAARAAPGRTHRRCRCGRA